MITLDTVPIIISVRVQSQNGRVAFQIKLALDTVHFYALCSVVRAEMNWSSSSLTEPNTLAPYPGRQLKRRPGLHCNTISAHALSIKKW